jgi:hypothetical protein
MDSSTWTDVIPYVKAALWLANVIVYGYCIWLWARPEDQSIPTRTATVRRDAAEFTGRTGARHGHHLGSEHCQSPAGPIAPQQARMRAQTEKGTLH